MADLKTKPTDQHVEGFIDAIDDPQQQEDSRTLVELMRLATNEEPKMWGDSIVGFGDYVLEELVSRSARHVAARYAAS